MKIFRHDRDTKVLMIVCIGLELNYEVMEYIANKEYPEFRDNRKVNFRKEYKNGIWSNKIDNWFTVVDTCNRFDYGYRISKSSFDTIKK